MIIIEVKTTGISMDGLQVDDLLASLTGITQCSSVTVLVDDDVDHQTVVKVLDITKKAGCENATIKAV